MGYSKEELHQCICEVMADSLPDDWQTAYMKVEIAGNEIDCGFRYRTIDAPEEIRFVPQNAIAAMNAAQELKTIMAAEGQDWSTATVTIFSDGRFEVHTESVS